MAKTEAKPTAETDPDWPRPWTRREDREGWEVVARGRDRKGPVGTAVLVELTQEQERWIMETAEQEGRTLAGRISHLIDQARRTAPVTRDDRT